ncbi:Phosphate acetyltransferase [Chromobacterium violaceum]|nr:Phosphate acetyltransferase [Chromobacterium violaceum]
MATSMAAMNGVPLAGLLLTCDSQPDPRIQQLCQQAFTGGLPVLATSLNSMETAGALNAMSHQVPSDDLERMEKVIEHVAEFLDVSSLKQSVGEPRELRLPPPAFRFQLMEKARKANKRIVLPEGNEPRTIQAAAICQEKGIARCVLLGNRAEILQVAETQGVTLPESVEILDPNEIRGRYVEPMVELRKGKGLNAPMALAQLEDTVVLGTMMLAMNEVDGLVSGAVHTTANTIRPALQLIKTAPGSSIVSSVFFMLMPEQVYVYGDCAVNPDPTAEQLADIAIQSADSAVAFGINPRVAMISYSTGSSGSGSDVEKVREATRIAQEKRPDLLIDGPMQYDAASVESVGRQKAPDSQVAGRATVFVFPDLNTGNTTYKAVQRSANVVSVGPMLQGLRKPVNDLSRGALVDDIVYTIALTALQAEQTPAS